MKYNFAAVIMLVFAIGFSGSAAASGDTLRISKKEAEALFLNNNLELVAQKLNIQQAEAQIIQAKLWPNPEFSLDELNLWATKNQLSSGESIPGLIGNFGKNREFTAELSQLIKTGGKRKKRIALESVSRDITTVYFSELIRELKTQLRKNLYELSFQQSYLSVLTTQHIELTKLLLSFEKQYAQGNLNKPELFRLKALKLDLNQQIVEAQKEVHGIQKELSVLLNLPSDTYLIADVPDQFNTNLPGRLSLDNLISIAAENRPDGRISILQQNLAQKTFDYEYARRKPDLTLGLNYDRGGNFLLNFFGFGLRFDVPVFNKNQGAILESKIGIEKSKVETQQKNRVIEAEVTGTFRDLQKSLTAYQNLDTAYITDLDHVFQSYTTYYVQRQINMVEYLDFFDAYISNKKTILLTLKQLQDSLEELNHATAAEVNE